MKLKNQLRDWIARFLIGLVLGMNLACAVDFIAHPKNYLASYELSGEVGRVVIIGLGILFLMWQIPYFFALYHPRLHKVSLIQAILMQAIGFIGETLLYQTIPLENSVLRGSILRFIWFDGSGLMLLVLAYLVGSRTASRLVKE